MRASKNWCINMLTTLLDGIDTPGGHILVLFALVFIGISCVKGGIAEGKDILIGAFGALLALLQLKRSEAKQAPPVPPVVPDAH